MPKAKSNVLKAIRDAGAEFQKSIASVADIVEEPLKARCKEATDNLTKMLSGLPEDGDDESFALLNQQMDFAKSYISILQETATKANESLQTMKASLPTEITSAIEAKVKAGELFTKEAHDTAITDATSSATTAAREKALGDAKRISERRLVLEKASIPVPADDVLGAEDKDFDARKATAEKRVGELKPFKLADGRMLALAWAADEKQYTEAVELMKAAWESASKGGAPNPFIANRNGADNKPAKKPVLLC